MNYNKKMLLGILILVSFVFILSHLVEAFLPPISPEHTQKCQKDLGYCPHEQQNKTLLELIPLLVSIGVLVGAGTYYLMSSQLESKQKALQFNSNVLLQFLAADEKALVNKLIECKGKALQAEVSRLPGMTRLKSHRVILKLMDKGVIEKEELGKTNIIKFKKEIREGLLQ